MPPLSPQTIPVQVCTHMPSDNGGGCGVAGGSGELCCTLADFAKLRQTSHEGARMLPFPINDYVWMMHIFNYRLFAGGWPGQLGTALRSLGID